MQTKRFVAIYAVAALVALLSLLIAPSVFGATTISTSISTGGNLTVTGNTTVSGNMTVSGNTTLGNAAADTITFTGQLAGGSFVFVKEVDATLSVQDSTTAATAGASLQIMAATGSTTGAGGATTIQGGTGGATSGTGGALNMYGGTGGTSGGNGGDTTVTGGDGTASAANGGDVYIRGGAKGSAGTNGNVLIGETSTNTITIGYASGTTTITGFTQHSAGTVSLPSISFSGDTDTGLFASAANTLQLVAGGNAPLQIGTSTTQVGVTITGSTSISGAVVIAAGAVGAPSIAFTGDSNTGLYSTSADNLSVTVGGTARLSASEGTQAVTITGTTTLAGSTTVTTGPFTVPAGAVGAPSIIFTGDSDTGLFASAANTLQLVAGGNAPLQIGTSTTQVGVTITGSTSVSGAVVIAAGAVGAPSVAFSGDSNTGIYSTGGDNLSVTVGGTQRLSASEGTQAVTITGTTTLAGSTTVTTGPFTVPAGAVGAPSIIFTGDSDTGLFASAANTLQLVAGGNAPLQIGTSTTQVGVTITGSTSISGNLTSGTVGANGSTTLDVAGSTTNTGLCKQGTPSAVDNVVLVDCDAAPAADYAERYPVAKDVDYGDIVVPGTRVVYTDSVQLPNADGSGFNTFPSHAIVELVKSNVPYQEPIVGIVSENWGDFTSAGNNINKKDNPRPVALVGRVPVKVTNEGGPIAIGDFLTTSSTPGHAMKATKAGRVIGMALGNFSGAKGKVMVQVLNTWWNPMVGENQTSAATTQIQPSINVALEKVEKLVVQKNATIQGRLIVKGNARFDGQITVGKDTAGMVSLKTGQKTARVDFGAVYKKMPVITVTPLGNPGGYFWVSDVSEKGFTVNVNKAPSSDLGFNWIALGSNAGLGEEEAKAKVKTAAAGTAQ